MTGTAHDPSTRPREEMARLRVFARFRDAVQGGQLVPPRARWAIGAMVAAAAGAAVALSVPLRFPDAVVPTDQELRVLADLHRTRALRAEAPPAVGRLDGETHR